MQKKTIVTVIAVIVLVAAWYAFRPERLFINETVNEGFPLPATTQAAATPAQPVLLSMGRFHDGAHKTSGSASIYRLPEGKRFLRLSEFETSNGPDVQVYLVAAPDATDNATVTSAGFMLMPEIGASKMI